MPTLAEASVTRAERRVLARLIELLRAEFGADLKSVLRADLLSGAVSAAYYFHSAVVDVT